MEKKSFLRKATPYLFILPWIIGFIVFTAGPLILSLVMSFFDWPITSTPTFRGLGNYVEMFTKDKQFYKSLVITLKYAAIFVPLNMIIALFLAMLITQPVKGVKIYRTIFYIPAVVSGVAISIIWGWILNGNYGVLNYLLSLLGIEGPNWLVDPSWALLAVILASAFDLITSLISSFQQLTLVMLLTNGGPLKSTYFYGMFTYNNAFKHHKLGYASANAWVMFVIILFLTALVFKSSSAWVFYETEAKNSRKKTKKGRK